MKVDWFQVATDLSRLHAREVLESEESAMLESQDWQNPPLSVAEHLELERMAGRHLTLVEAHAFRREVVLSGAFDVWINAKEVD